MYGGFVLEVRMNTIGYHYIVEAAGCKPYILSDPDRIQAILTEGAKRGNMTIRSSYFYRFSPQGVSGVLIVAESHISIHTWPEYQYAALDVYVCGDDSNPEASIDYILEQFGSSHAHISEVKRGVQDEDVFTHTILTWEETLRKEKHPNNKTP